MPPSEPIRINLSTKDWTARQAMRQAILGVQMLDSHIAHLEYMITVLKAQLAEEHGEPIVGSG